LQKLVPKDKNRKFMAELAEGAQAPYFEGRNQKEEIISLTSFQGKKLVLYFYPKDMTPGCTAESCNLNDNLNILKDKGFEVLGVSPDSVAKHQKFIEKYGFNFDLIADEEKEILQMYDAWGEKKMYGKTYMGVLRKTYIIDENGKILKIFDKVKTKDHTNQILKELEK